MKKPKHNFNLESKANKDGERLIYLNLSYGYKDTTAKNNLRYTPMRLSTQWTIKEEYWDGKPHYRANVSYVRRFGKDLNNAIDRVEKESYTQLSYYREQNGSDPAPSELKKLILEKLKRVQKTETDNRLIDFIKKVIKTRTSLPSRSKKYWKETTESQYNTLINHLEQYEEKTGRVLVFEGMTEEIYWDYFRVLNEIRVDKEGIGYTQTTMHKDYKHLDLQQKVGQFS